jgi:hypothetical protein
VKHLKVAFIFGVASLTRKHETRFERLTRGFLFLGQIVITTKIKCCEYGPSLKRFRALIKSVA